MEERGRLLPRRPDVLRQRRRRLRRPAGPHRADGLPRRDRRHLHLAHAVPPLARARRRLRHRRLLRRGPEARHARRLRRHGPHGRRPGHPGHRRPGRQPHVGPPPVVPGGALLARLPLPQLLRLARRQAGGEAGRRRLPGRGGVELGLRRGGGPVVPAPLLHRAARPERRQSGGARRARADRGLLGTAGPRRLPGGRRALPDRAGRAPGGRSRTPTSCWRTCAPTSAAGAATPSCWAR